MVSPGSARETTALRVETEPCGSPRASSRLAPRRPRYHEVLEIDDATELSPPTPDRVDGALPPPVGRVRLRRRRGGAAARRLRARARREPDVAGHVGRAAVVVRAAGARGRAAVRAARDQPADLAGARDGAVAAAAAPQPNSLGGRGQGPARGGGVGVLRGRRRQRGRPPREHDVLPARARGRGGGRRGRGARDPRRAARRDERVVVPEPRAQPEPELRAPPAAAAPPRGDGGGRARERAAAARAAPRALDARVPRVDARGRPPHAAALLRAARLARPRAL